MEGVNLIGYIDYKDISVPVYNDSLGDNDNVICTWQSRNPNSFYTGVLYKNLETGAISYPEGAIIPIQTDRDKEIIPKFIVTGRIELDSNFIMNVIHYIDSEYKRINKIVETK